MRPPTDDAVKIVFLSLKQGFKRIAYWIRPNLWAFLLSISVVLAPAATAGLCAAVIDGLRDPGESRAIPRISFRNGFFNFFGRSAVLSLVNLILLVFMAVSVLFWTRQDSRFLNLLSIPGFYCLIIWWMAQPFLFPALLENPTLSTLGVIKHTTRLVFVNPFFAIVIALANTALAVIGIMLLGPILLIVPAIMMLISVQGYWRLINQEIPDWFDPTVYEQRLHDKTITSADIKNR